MSAETLDQVTLTAEQYAGSEMARVQHFQEALAAVEGTYTVDMAMPLETPTPVQDTVKYFLDMEVKPGTNLYLDRGLEGISGAGKPLFTPLRSRGKHSAHGILFGNLTFEDGTVTPVAVKPHDIESKNSCATDYFTNIAASNLNLETLKPVGMIMGPGDTAYSMTKLEQGLGTLDGVDWGAVIEKEGYDGETMAVWGQTARQAGMLHSLGSVSHGDLAARNIAITDDESGVFFIDWEHASISTMPPRDAEARYMHSRKDMGDLMESLVRPQNDPYKAGIDLFRGYEDPWDGFAELVFDEYVQTRLGFAAETGDLVEVQSEIHELERSLKDHLDLVLRKT